MLSFGIREAVGTLDFVRRVCKKLRSGWLREFYQEALWIWAYIRRYRLTVVIHVLLALLSTALGLGTSVASKYLIDAVTGHKTGSIGLAAAVMAGMMLTSILLRGVCSRIGAKINIRVRNEIQAEVYHAILHTAWEPLEAFRSGDLLSRLTGDVDTVAGSVTSFAPGLVSGLAQFTGALVIMLCYDPTMALIALISIPVSVLLSRLLVGRMRDHSRKMKEISSDVMSFYEDSLSNITSIKAFGITGLFYRRMLLLQGNYRGEYLDFNRFSVRTSACLSLLGAAVSAGCFGWGVFRLWSGAITYGSLTMFLQLASALSSSFSALIGLVSSAISISTSAGRVMAVTQLPAESGADTLTSDELRHVSVCIRGASFSYQSGEPVLKSADFYAAENEFVALTGPSGEGKTTMLRMLLGLIQPKSGTASLLCDGAEYALSAATRRAFSYVPQGNSMFSGTIRENLRLTDPDADDARLEAALRAACAWVFVSALPDKLDHRLGGHGKGLSEGQAQRLSIARALLRGAPILLLDEATSALDEATETQLLRNLRESPFVHTCIFVTHRPAAAAICSRRYRAADGIVREENACSENI